MQFISKIYRHNFENQVLWCYFLSMNIISGTARNIELTVPAGLEVRPTSGRARKALFDSLGSFQGLGVLDLCSGSGALALEAASRGASRAFMVELSQLHCKIISENIAKVTKAGVTTAFDVINSDILDVKRYLNAVYACNIIFADPPYAISAKLFTELFKNEDFLCAASGCTVIWELPDTPGTTEFFIDNPAFSDFALRRFASTVFLKGYVK